MPLIDALPECVYDVPTDPLPRGAEYVLLSRPDQVRTLTVVLLCRILGSPDCHVRIRAPCGLPSIVPRGRPCA